MNFGSSSWGSSTGFGNSANSSNPAAGSTNPGGGLFGNSSTQNNNTTSANPGSGASSGGLFGNSQTGSNKRASTGLFGNSSTPQPSGGLFGNSSTTSQAPSGGLFGNSGSKPGGLFGNSTTQAGPTASTGSSLLNKPSGGLFGNSTSTNNTTTAGSGGLFGNSNTSNASNPSAGGGLFGNKPAGGLFGSSNETLNKPATSGGLFGNSTQQPQQVSANKPDPYNSSSILSTIQHSADTMPASLTGSLFANSTSNRSASVSASSKEPQRKSSLLGKLAQTFNIFRYNTEASGSNSSVGKLKGLFTQSNYIRDTPHSRSDYAVKKPQKRLARLPIENKSVGDVKRLVIQSRPSKFHQINADKVFSAKKRRVLIQSLDDKLTSTNYDDLHNAQDTLQEKESFKKEATPQPKESVDESEIYGGYWCSPSIAELENMTDEQLSSVDNFIVGRKTKGQITYIFPVDLTTIFDRSRANNVPVSSIIFDDIIKIEDGFVKVYFDYEAAKPPISRELNVPAIITLKSEPRKRSLEDHIKRLKNVVGAEFITYDPIEFYWTFKVKHFSVWGLIDDSEDEADESAERKRIRAVKKKQEEQEEESSRVYSRIYEDPAYQKEIKRQKIIKQSEGVPGAWDYGSIAQHDNTLSMKQRMIDEEITRQVKAYKEDHTADALAANVSDITVQSSEDEAEEEDALIPAPFADDEKFNYLKQIVSVLPPYTDMKSLVDEKAYEPVLESDQAFLNLKRPVNLPTSEDWLVQLEMSNDLNSSLAPYVAIPRKSGSALQNVNDILFSDFNKSSVGIDQVSTPIKEKAPAQSFEPQPTFNKRIITSLVQTLLLNSPVTSRPNGLPLTKLPPSITFAQIAAIDQEDFETFKLASILFDPIHIASIPKYKDVNENDGQLVNRLQQIEQRSALSQWLRKYNKEKLQPTGDALHNIFINVVNGQLKEAIELAISSKNVHLSVLLTLLDSNDKAAREIAKSQLEDWPSEDNLVPQPIINIYRILSGDFSSLDGLVSPAAKLSVLVNYDSSTRSIPDLLEEVSFDSDKGEIAELLQFYKSFEKSGPKSASQQLQEAGVSILLKWTLAQLLGLDSSTGDSICQKFSSGLEHSGLWKEALFIYAMISDDNVASDNLRRLIMQNVKSIKGDVADEEEYLVQVLKVPRSLIYEAVAEHRDKEKDFWGKGDALVTAELWDKVHDNIVAELGPTSVISRNPAHWSRLLAMIDRFPEQGRIIPSWNQGGGLFSTYFEVRQAYDKFEDIDPQKIVFLLENIAQFSTNDSFKIRAAVSVMVKLAGDLAIEGREPIPDAQQKIQAVNLGENERVYFKGRFAAST
ncbi:uncharacterized protein CXQ87_005290 [Candidozyma duobushaemuli]|uniref:Peptidase S59 domain-containing protein n=1 Tax=Candidozyma duobushaemuli TaxID=1231522 RepID=A0A2V1ADS5_9ASCO|nr:uncharacterized protein CXQ87_005290 [[Candida] duobushaemulonis]PVH15011.1 hypothetical protein CXQ87_005290 [[Candida] duobushaemulonis]